MNLIQTMFSRLDTNNIHVQHDNVGAGLVENPRMFTFCIHVLMGSVGIALIHQSSTEENMIFFITQLINQHILTGRLVLGTVERVRHLVLSTFRSPL